ncbi:MAG: divergent PAP2 family protein, partial [Firmicutes bacterium]|nr:divergent PAP2 family protein [Bacillota bacterium]
MVAALATAVGYDYGWTSALFAVSCVFGLVVLYDAIGVRRTVGLQSRYLNRVSRTRKEFDVLDREFPEYVGHTPREVVAGALWGILISWWLH